MAGASKLVSYRIVLKGIFVVSLLIYTSLNNFVCFCWLVVFILFLSHATNEKNNHSVKYNVAKNEHRYHSMGKVI